MRLFVANISSHPITSSISNFRFNLFNPAGYVYPLRAHEPSYPRVWYSYLSNQNPENAPFPVRNDISAKSNPASRLQVRAAEDILSLTRILKESWLFGKLQTVGTIEAERKAEESAVAVAEGLRKLGMIGEDEMKS